MLVRLAGVVKSVGQMVEIRLLSGQRIFAPKKNLVVGQKIKIVFNAANKCLSEIEEMLKKGDFSEALFLYYDPDADYTGTDLIDFEILEPPGGSFWNPQTGVIDIPRIQDEC